MFPESQLKNSRKISIVSMAISDIPKNFVLFTAVSPEQQEEMA